MKRPWEGPQACGCGAAGAPCGRCNEPAEPRMSAGFRTEIEKDSWRAFGAAPPALAATPCGTRLTSQRSVKVRARPKEISTK